MQITDPERLDRRNNHETAGQFGPARQGTLVEGPPVLDLAFCQARGVFVLPLFLLLWFSMVLPGWSDRQA